MNYRASWDRLAAEYALGTLRGAARARFESLMSCHSELAATAARWQEAFSSLDSRDMPVRPPDRVWRGILSRLPPVQDASLDTPPPRQANAARGHRHGFAGRWGWQIASVALAAGLIIAILRPFHTQPNVPGAIPIAVLASTEQATPEQKLVVSLASAGRELIVTPLNLHKPAANRSLQLWLIVPGRKPVSLGLVAAETTTVMDLHAQHLGQGITLAISIEPLGGSPTGQPTGAVLYSGKIGHT
jgi:anti-sigma-K factor RskA